MSCVWPVPAGECLSSCWSTTCTRPCSTHGASTSLCRKCAIPVWPSGGIGSSTGRCQLTTTAGVATLNTMSALLCGWAVWVQPGLPHLDPLQQQVSGALRYSVYGAEEAVQIALFRARVPASGASITTYHHHHQQLMQLPACLPACTMPASPSLQWCRCCSGAGSSCASSRVGGTAISGPW